MRGVVVLRHIEGEKDTLTSDHQRCRGKARKTSFTATSQQRVFDFCAAAPGAMFGHSHCSHVAADYSPLATALVALYRYFEAFIRTSECFLSHYCSSIIAQHRSAQAYSRLNTRIQDGVLPR